MTYRTYAEIPIFTKEYIQTVANVKDIDQVSLDDINGFLTGLQEYAKMSNENNEGWK